MHLPTDPSDEGIKAFSQGDPGSRPYDTPVLTQEAPSRVPAEVQSGDTQTDHAAACSAAVSTPPGRRSFLHTVVPAFVQTSWMKKCYSALKSILPVYIAIHLAFIVISGLAVLFVLIDFSPQSKPIYTLWQSWHHWDTGNYLVVALHGYVAAHQTAFFPFYPLLERCLMVVTHNPFTAGLIISNLAGLMMLVVLYRLVEEDSDAE